LLYKVIDSRSRKGSTALVTNIDFKDWTDYLGDPPLAMALLDRVVDGARPYESSENSKKTYVVLSTRSLLNSSHVNWK